MKAPNKREFQQIASNHWSDIYFKDFMKLYKDYTKEPYSSFVNNTTQKGGVTKMNISEKIKAINNKIQQNKAQYYLDKQTAKISTLLSRNIS